MKEIIGVALVDIGGGSTTYAIFKDGELQATTVIPLGGDHITKDISDCAKNTNRRMRKKLRLKYGHAFYDDASEEEIFRFLLWEAIKQQQYNQL